MNLFNFNTSNNDNVLLITGKNATGKTTIVDGIKWCLYSSKTKHLTILNQDIIEFPATVSAELIFQEKGVNYKVVTNQFYTAKSSCSNTETKLYKHNLDWEEISNIEISNFIPQYVSDFTFISEEINYSNLNNTSIIITNFINKVKHEGIYDINEDIFIKTFNQYMNNLLNIVYDKMPLNLKIDNQFKLQITDSNNTSYNLATTERTIVSFIVSATLAKMFFEYNNSSGFIINDGILGLLDPPSKKRFIKGITNLPFEQILIFASDASVIDVDYISIKTLNNSLT